jgi:aspartyl aminopeptidase
MVGLCLTRGVNLRPRSVQEWTTKPGGKYFFIRNATTIVAFALGGKFEPGNGFNVVAAHTDSPCLKLKPITSSKKSGFLKVGVQTYGGGLWYTWCVSSH